MLSLDRTLDVLAVEYRRDVIKHLAAVDGSVGFETLVGRIVESGTTDRESARIALYHSHIPKLENGEVIEFDYDDGVVSPGPQLRSVAAALDAVETAQRVPN
ncbi:MAG: hypothetical protein QXG03_12655 [Halalkalicoccus sp.]